MSAGAQGWVPGNPSYYNGVAVQGQCVVFAGNYAAQVLGEPIPSIGQFHPYNGHSGDSQASDSDGAHWIWDDLRLQPAHTQRIANDGTSYPQSQDIVVWSSSVGLGYGHIAIVCNDPTSATTVQVVDSNWKSDEKGLLHALSGLNNVLGWFRHSSQGAPPNPTCAFTNPAQDGVQVTSPITVSGTDGDPGSTVAGVKLFLDGAGTPFATVSNPGPTWSASFNPAGYAAGTHTVTLTVTDQAGATFSCSRAIMITGNPAGSIASPSSDGAVVSGLTTISGTDGDSRSAVASVKLFLDGASSAFATINSPGPAWSVPFNPTYCLPGSHVITLAVTDAAGTTFQAAQTIAIRHIVCDLDGGGTYDMLAQNSATGEIAYWLTNGYQIVTAGTIATQSTDWKVVGSPDLNGDCHPDILVQNAATGEIAYWIVQNYQIVADGTIAMESTDWQVVGTPDLNGDGKPDILVQSKTTGEVAYWILQNCQIVANGTIAFEPTSWHIVGTPDLNGDGHSDILVQNVGTGEIAYWILTGTTITGDGTIATEPLQWQVVGAPDIDGDGRPDILVRNTQSGDIAYWLLTGTTITGDGTILAGEPLQWQIAGMH
nr:FG-GAP-like repeat-containing protein [Capsulimonas corticalis]